MHTSLILKKMKIFSKEKGIGSVLKMLAGQTVWTSLCPLLKSKYAKQKISKKQILFVSRPDYSDNAFYLYDYMRNHKKYEGYSFVWLVESGVKNYADDEDAVFYKMHSDWHYGLSRNALKAVLTSEYIFFTHTSPFHKLEKRGDQTVVNLWHGCGYKSIKSTNEWEKENPFDYALVPGKVFVETKSAFWACSRDKILTIGYPRYDEFKNVSEETKRMATSLKGNADKLLLWMPTYRKTELGQFAVSKIEGFFELPIVESEDGLKRLDRYCSENRVVICIKRHRSQVRYRSEEIELQSIKFIDDGDFRTADASLYGLLSCVDGLITDYSSVAIDYLLLDKPMAFSLDDFKEYGDTQGFVFEDPLKYMPGSHVYTYDDLLNFIDDVINGIDRCKEKREAIMPEVHNPCECYCRRICDYFDL